MKKKLLALLLAAATLISTASCGTNDDSISEAVVDTTAISATAAKTVETTTVTTEATTTVTTTTVTSTTTSTITTTSSLLRIVPSIADELKNFTIKDVPAYSGDPYVAINDNIPYFNEYDKYVESIELYSDLDNLGRCGTAYACIGQDLMPTANRGSISEIKPTGWQSVEYDNVDGGYLYNRCHLIGFQLTGENANEKNLITGTRYLNVEGMLPFENMTADYIKSTDNHVLYRVTPIFDGDNLLCDGVVMEGLSVEDDGDGICFNVFCYNVQPDIKIDYSSGKSETIIVETEPETEEEYNEPIGMAYVVNTNTGKFHYPSCSSAKKIKSANRWDYNGNRDDLISMGYVPCKNCHP